MFFSLTLSLFETFIDVDTKHKQKHSPNSGSIENIRKHRSYTLSCALLRVFRFVPFSRRALDVNISSVVSFHRNFSI